MFDALTGSLQRVFKKLRSQGRLTEESVQDAMREIRLALLEADVNFKVVRDFVESVRVKCIGREVLDSVTPGQQVVKIVYDEMVALLGGSARALDLNAQPATVLLLGLHGSGKTTTAGKLAREWVGKRGRRVLLAAADIRRPAAVEQLAILAGQAGADVLRPEPGETVPALGARALDHARRSGHDIVLFDTGGRFQIDDELVAELRDLQAAVNARNVLLVVDAALGQESVNVASVFHEQVGLTGLVLTKLDGDARGGAALSIRSVTGCPVVYTGTGETLDALDVFHPDRMASRILGMGDVLSLVERAQESVDLEQAQRLEKKLRKNALDLEDFLDQLRQVRKMGSFESLLEMLPLPGNIAQSLKGNPRAADQMKSFAGKAEAIIQSMTPQERRNPKVLNGSRRKRIARGSGTSPADINDLMRRFDQAREMTRRLGKMQKSLKSRR